MFGDAYTSPKRPIEGPFAFAVGNPPRTLSSCVLTLWITPSGKELIVEKIGDYHVGLGVGGFSRSYVMTGYTTLDPCRKAYCRPVINTPPPCKGLDIRIPSVVPI